MALDGDLPHFGTRRKIAKAKLHPRNYKGWNFVVTVTQSAPKEKAERSEESNDDESSRSAVHLLQT